MCHGINCKHCRLYCVWLYQLSGRDPKQKQLYPCSLLSHFSPLKLSLNIVCLPVTCSYQRGFSYEHGCYVCMVSIQQLLAQVCPTIPCIHQYHVTILLMQLATFSRGLLHGSQGAEGQVCIISVTANPVTDCGSLQISPYKSILVHSSMLVVSYFRKGTLHSSFQPDTVKLIL